MRPAILYETRRAATEATNSLVLVLRRMHPVHIFTRSFHFSNTLSHLHVAPVHISDYHPDCSLRATRLAHVGLSNTDLLTDAFTHLSHVHFGNSIKILCASLPKILGLLVANCLPLSLFRQDSWQ